MLKHEIVDGGQKLTEKVNFYLNLFIVVKALNYSLLKPVN